MKRIAISQSNYIPWKGYFDLINMVDEFVLYDDVQYTKRDWRNRNKIKAVNGPMWLSIPVHVKGKYFQKIKETTICDPNWARVHWSTIKQFYAKAEYFTLYQNTFEDYFLSCTEENLSQINTDLIKIINNILGINTKITRSSDYEIVEGQTEALVSICQQAGANSYFSGPAAKTYFDETYASTKGLVVHWMNYDGYREYSQLYPPFEHSVSILDLLFNEGPNSCNYMKSF